ncbi:hypothetical protein O9929_24700 [Vibrio lentus]|nr:hypothetical protein [Vibrio lentus]
MFHQVKGHGGCGWPAVCFYEVMTFEVAADATNASAMQYLVALYYKQEVFRRPDDSQIHDVAWLLHLRPRIRSCTTLCTMAPRHMCYLQKVLLAIQ